MNGELGYKRFSLKTLPLTFKSFSDFFLLSLSCMRETPETKARTLIHCVELEIVDDRRSILTVSRLLSIFAGHFANSIKLFPRERSLQLLL